MTPVFTIGMSGTLYRTLQQLDVFGEDAPKEAAEAFRAATTRMYGRGTRYLITAPRPVVIAVLEELEKLVREVESKAVSARELGLDMEDLRCVCGQAMWRAV